MPQTKVRVVGSGFTTFNYNGRPIAYLDNVRDSGQSPIAAPEAITPLGSRHPVEIATARVLGVGTLTCSIFELWNEPVWWQLQGLRGTHDIVSIYDALAANANLVTCQMIIAPPAGVGPRRGKTYHNCVVTNIDDSENITIGAISVAKGITISYTHSTRL